MKSSNARIYDDSYAISDYPKQNPGSEVYRRGVLEHNRKLRKKEKIHASIYRAKLLLAIITVFAGSFGIMLTTAMSKQMETNIIKLHNELESLQTENAELSREISESIDLTYIDNYAKESLNMGPPEDYQIIYIDVPDDSYTVNYTIGPEEESEKSFFSVISNIFIRD